MSNLHIQKFEQFGQYFSNYPYYLPAYYGNYYPRKPYEAADEDPCVGGGVMSMLDIDNPMSWVLLFIALMVLFILAKRYRG